MKNVNFGQKSYHCSVNKDFAIDNSREKLQGLQNDTDSILDSEIGRGFNAENHRMNAIKEAEPFSPVGSLPTDVMKSEHHVLDEEFDLDHAAGSNPGVQNVLSAIAKMQIKKRSS